MVLLACTFIGSGTSALASPSFIGSHTEESLQVELVSQNKDRVVTGTVVDAVEGTPLIGANVMIKGMKTGVITDLNGNYSVKVSNSKDVLVVSYIGMATGKVKVQPKLTITLKSE